MTYTYVELELTDAAFQEISRKLKAAGYDHAFHGDVIDMHGIAVKSDGTREHEWQFYANGSFCRRCGAAIGSGRPCR